jgi:hypothetical protein
MNLAEKLAMTYLRLNGFLTLPQFTIFDGSGHNHIDLIGLRAPNSQETVNGLTLITDDLLFEKLTQLIGQSSRIILLGIAAEVRTNDSRDEPSTSHIQYLAKFLGEATIARLSFYEGTHDIQQNNQTLDISIKHVGKWVLQRINWMQQQTIRLTKTGSWNWSEDFLSDLLVLQKNGLLANDNNG